MDSLTDIAEWNDLVGNDSQHRDLKSKEFRAQYNLIKEEFDIELGEAMDNNDRIEGLDALGDTIVVVAGAIHRLGSDPKEVVDIIMESNHSKFIDPTNEDEVRRTLEKYHNHPEYGDIVIDENGVVTGLVYVTGTRKVLKGCNYHKPKWENLSR